MLDKQTAGCSFFVTQVVYDTNAAKNLVSDYRDECDARDLRPRPIAFTLSVCGSPKTLQFLTWLGVQVPQWMQRDLQRSNDTLRASLQHSRAVGLDLLAYCQSLGIPAGFNIESVSSRRIEIDAAVKLATGLRAALEG
jgi:5,10-methylenetetrahydrofolate reductase